jgi:aspartate aminotransferase
MDLSLYILQHYFVSLVPGEAFGDERCIRFSFAADDAALATAMRRFADALASLV